MSHFIDRFRAASPPESRRYVKRGLDTICARKQQKITEQVEGMNKKILIVEDNNDSLEILGLRVTNFGYEAIKARNSKEAIACVEAEPPEPNFHGYGSAGCRWSQDNRNT